MRDDHFGQILKHNESECNRVKFEAGDRTRQLDKRTSEIHQTSGNKKIIPALPGIID